MVGRGGVDTLFGDWVTDKGITVRVHRLSDGVAGAEIISAPGFFSNDTGAGSVVLRNIRPYSDGFAGDFVMPGGLPPVNVSIRFLNSGTIVFDTRDKRTGGNKMVWRRVPVGDSAPKQ